jgi:hypothetical protein
MAIVLSLADTLGLVVGYVLCSLLHVVVHELGHLAAGLVLAMRVCGIRVAGMTIGRRPRGAARTTTVANAVFAEPRPGSQLLRLRSVTFVLAGPAANLAAATATLDLALRGDLGHPAQHVLYGATAAGALLGLGNLAPFTTSRGTSDGRKVLRCSACGGYRSRCPHCAWPSNGMQAAVR